MRILFCFLVVWAMLPAEMVSQNKLTSQEKKNGWILLFDGVSTNGWTTTKGKTVPAGWEVNNGSITAIKNGKGGDIISENEYSDFDLFLDYKLEPGTNSGVKYFFTKYDNGGNLGMEFQIIDDKLGEDTNKENHLTGALYDVLPPIESKKKINDSGQWNTLRIVAKGKEIEHWLNGKKILEFTRGSNAYTNAIAQSKFNETMPLFGMVDKGHILLQEHGGVISFQNIKIKLLK